LKFGKLWDKDDALGCDCIGKGHYAIIEHHSEGAVLRKGIDARKDQSYFLFSLRQEQLRRALTPLGGMSKPEIREIARELGLKVADKPDSQEICFVPGQDYKAFLRSHLGEETFRRGGIYDLQGNYIAAHHGIEMFTIGQRRGLPGGSMEPRYVVDIDAETNRVVVGNAQDLLIEEFEVNRMNWTGARIPFDHERDCTVKIRYNHPGTAAMIASLDENRCRVQLREAQRAITPGKAAVFYDGDVVLGGGWICRKAAPVPA
jgi:tRNA-specific 2-thiouridylase